ncbi:MobF family relaxase [Pseudonocardia sp. 73-21]|uniref:MobF family relaxase n=1 Tax=Pseudonocardia sp. 73-21 TaxID=1895809 RepID=UPI000AC16847|nr:MobF family relaxase [Pseudonocardia sp. 73-21]
MLSVHRGHSVRYLTDEVAKAREGYYTGAVAAGEPPGQWWGRGAETLGLAGDVDADLMEAVYTHLRDPRDHAARDRTTWDQAAALAAGHRKYRAAEQIYAGLLDEHPDAGPEERAALRAQAGRSARQAVSFIDVTFSAPKSVTVSGLAFERAANEARACGDLDAAAAWDVHARAVEDAMMAGTRAGLAYLQEHAGYSRVGHHGGGSGRWIDAHEFVVAQFFQHDSRERDPQWHIHNAILNRVLCSDGVWRGLDGRGIDEHKAAAGAIAERVMEAHLARSLGLRTETRPDGKAREVVGVDRDLMDLYSSRRAQIGPKAAELIRQFTAAQGREPSPYERVVIHEQATLVTRKAKSHDGETREEQFARWEEMARDRVTGGLAALAEHLAGRAQDPGEVAEFSPRDVIERAVAEIRKTRAHYSRSDMVQAVSNALPGHLGVEPDDVGPLLMGLTDAALDLAQRLTPVEDAEALPDELRLANGESVYSRHGSARYATPGQIAAERSLIAAAVERGAHRFAEDRVDEVCARFADSGMRLGPDQEAALRGVLTSGAQVEVITAAAGTGKSFVVGAIADTWTDPDEELPRRVFGLAPYQNAAEVLAGEGLPAKNVRAWLATQGRIDRTRPGQTAVGPNGDDEAWRLRPGDMVVVDETGTAETGDLVAIRARCRAAGVKLLLVGDPRQLTTIGPGGALADISEHGVTYQLAEVRRFDNEWEGPASLRLRDGDPDVLAEYDKRGRLVDGGTAEQAEAAASRAWLADTLDGHDSLLMVGTNAAAARVSGGLRAELVRLGRVAEDGVPLGEGPALAEWRGTAAGVGDLVQARALAWHLRGFEGNGAAPITQQTYRVIATRPDGGLTVAPIDRAATDGERNLWGEVLGAPMQLPGTYVREHVSLGYASTKDAAQGRTVDTSHSVIGPGTDAAGVYVPATRGRARNTLYAVTRHLAPDAETGETLEVAERTGAAVLADCLANVRQDRSAHAEQVHAEAEARSVMTQIDRMADLIREVNAGRTAATLDRLATAGRLTDHERCRLAADDAFGSLERLLRTAELAGHDPDQVLAAAIEARSLTDADSPAQVIHHRITHALAGRLTPRPREGAADLIPHHLRADAVAVAPADAKRAARLHQLAEAADTRRHELGALTAEQAPAWAVDALGAVPEADQVVARQDWEHRAGWAAAYRELVAYTDEQDPLGHAPGKGRVEHAVMFRAAHEALALVDAGAEEADLSDGALRARVRAYDRELTWAPRWVDDELAATHQAHAKATTDATVWNARADAPDTDPADAARLRADAAAARAEAERYAEQIAQLEVVDEARAAWFTHTAVTRDRADRARVELKARGVDLDHPDDSTTGPQWLALHRAEQADREREQPVTEVDVVDDEIAFTHRRDEAEAVAPDVRDTSTPDPTETADPSHRRHVPPAAESTLAVQRAQESLAEIAQRRAADAARAEVDAAERDAAEAARREELARWSTEPELAIGTDDHVLTRED